MFGWLFKRVGAIIVTIIAVSVLAAAAVLGLRALLGQLSPTPNSNNDCETICVSVKYTCTNEVRTSVHVEFFNGTVAGQTIIIHRKITNQFGETSDAPQEVYAPNTGSQFDREAKPETTFTFRIESGGQVLAEDKLGPTDPCEADDTRK